MNDRKKQPVDAIKRGNIIVSIWANETSNGVFYNITSQRFYRDGDSWKYSDSFGRDDILLLNKCQDEALSRIFQLQDEAKANAE